MPPWNWLPEGLEAAVASEVNEQGRDDTPAEGRGDAVLTHDQRGFLVNFEISRRGDDTGCQKIFFLRECRQTWCRGFEFSKFLRCHDEFAPPRILFFIFNSYMVQGKDPDLSRNRIGLEDHRVNRYLF